MIGSAMAYAVIVASLLSVAALAFERICALRQWPRRFVWLAALLASLVLPGASLFLHERAAPAVAQFARAVPSPSTGETNSLAIPAPSSPAATTLVHFEWPDAPQLDAWLLRAWALTSGLALLVIASGLVRLRRLRGAWDAVEQNGQWIRWSDRVGPAVIGWWRPEIVMPRSLRDSADAEYAFVMAHELGHIVARDPLLLFAARLLVAVAPWNLPLWWHLRRLQFAIEVDCDARVLAQGLDPVAYGHTLLSIAEQRAHIPLPAVALTEPASQLEKRIRIMTTEKPRRYLVPVVLFGALSVSFIACATQIAVPPLPANTLERFSGFYQYADNSIVTVRRDGDHLTIQFPGQELADALYSEGDNTFSYRDIDAKVQFASGGDSGADSAVLLQNGARTVMPRVDAATARERLAAAAQKVRDQTPSSGSEAALRRLIAGIEAGDPHLNELNPQLAGAVRNDLPKLQLRLKELGPVQSMQFIGVDSNGQDKYRVVHSGGTTEEWSIQLDSRGVIDGAMVPL